MGKNVIDSFSFPVEEVVIIEKFVKIAEREGKSKSALIQELIKAYVKEHGDGNSAFTLTHWQDDAEFKVTPAFFESNKKWDCYLDRCNRKELTEIEVKAIFIQKGAHLRWFEKKE